MNGWLIFGGIVVAYWAIGIRRLPVYYRRWYDADREAYSSIHTVEYSQKSAYWNAVFVACFWPYYEAGRWVRDHAIGALTAEERAKAEFEKAERIVAEYTQRKEREARADFEKKLRDTDG